MIENLEIILNEVKTVAIAGHVRPDGDAVGSCMAMYNYLDTYYPTLEVSVYLESIPNVFEFLKNTDKIKLATEEDQSKVFDLFIVCDCGAADRLGDAYHFFDTAKKTICIDHHQSNGGKFADYNYIVPDESSTCELVYNQLPKDRITKEIAECLYTGIIHDTGVFQYNCTTEETMRCAGKLMSMGINYPSICEDTYYAKSYTQQKMMGLALLNCKRMFDDKIIASVITLEDMEKYGALPKQLDGIVQQLRNTTGVEVAIFLYELEKGDFKASTRATRLVDLSVLASEYGGGGHKMAAGFNVKTEDPWKAIDQIAEKVNEQFIALGI